MFVVFMGCREVEARLTAVEEIKESTNYKLEDIASLLTRLPDLEKGLVRIHYGRVSSPLCIVLTTSVPVLNFCPFSKHYRVWHRNFNHSTRPTQSASNLPL